jgi:uncharacterized membrane protein YkvA (DUF1232 family)
MDFPNFKDMKCLGTSAKCLITMLLVFYVISPIDLLPEAVLGPIGLIDDFFALLMIFGINSTTAFSALREVFPTANIYRKKLYK